MHVPAILKNHDQWMLWCFDDDGAKRLLNKHGHYSGSTHVDDFMSFEEAETYFYYPGVMGLAFILTEDDQLACIDLDDCFDGDELKPWAKPIVAKMKSYGEVSPSLRGLKYFMIGKAQERNQVKLEDGSIEIYDFGRFLTFTGLQFHNSECEDDQQAIDEIYEEYFPKPVPMKVMTSQAIPGSDVDLRGVEYID